MRTINTESDAISYHERPTHHAAPGTYPPSEDSLDQLAISLTQMKEMINHSVLALTRIEQRLNRAQHKQSSPEVLSNRELQILKLATNGRTKLQIADSLAQRLLNAAQAAQAHSWTTDEVLLILRWLTPYPGHEISPAETRRAKALLHALGGPQVAQERLEQIAEQWRRRYPLHGEILHKFLAGWERREIVQYMVEQGYYEDSRIYSCIKELPYRICEHLRRIQRDHEEDADIG